MQKTEFEKMRSSELYCFEDSQVWESIKRANTLCARFSALTLSSPDYREVVEQLIPGLPKSSMVTPPFRCDHGSGIVIGHDTFINYDCIMLDGGYIFLTLIELVTRRKFSPKAIERVNTVGFYFVLAIMALGIFNDLARMVFHIY